MLKFFTLFAFLFFCSINLVYANFDFNSNSLKAYNSIFELKLSNAKIYLANEKRIRSNNSLIPLLENYLDYFSILTSDSKSEFDKLKNNKAARLKQISSDSDRNSPYYLYAQAEINLQWALLRSRYGEYFNSALEIKRAYSLLQENQKKFPNFPLNKKGLGLINAVLGKLPDGALKSALSTLGIKGNLQVGLNLLEDLTESLPKSNYSHFYNEVAFYYAYVLTDVAYTDNSYKQTLILTSAIPDSSLLKTYLISYAATKSNHADDVLNALTNRPKGSEYIEFPYLYYLEGTAMLTKLDFNAQYFFNKFLQMNRGVSFIKDTYLKMAWIALLKGNNDGFENYIQNVKSRGYTYQEKDKQAVSEANSKANNSVLLKSRLLFDGGYFNKALSLLNESNKSSFNTVNEITEYNYRKARILHKMNKVDSAIPYYAEAIKKGSNLKEFYAANAALNLGNIYKSKSDFVKAKFYYNTAIDMKNHDYESGIESQAKAELRKIK